MGEGWRKGGGGWIGAFRERLKGIMEREGTGLWDRRGKEMVCERKGRGIIWERKMRGKEMILERKRREKERKGDGLRKEEEREGDVCLGK